MISNRCNEYRLILNDLAHKRWLLTDEEKAEIIRMLVKVQDQLLESIYNEQPETHHEH